MKLVLKLRTYLEKSRLPQKAAFLVFSLFFSVSGFAKAPEGVNFLNWAEYIDPTVIPKFEARTGIPVHQSFYDGDDMLRAKLMANRGNYDLVVADYTDIPQLSKAQAIQTIDTQKLSNYRYRDPALYQLLQELDPGNRYGLIYLYGTTGISYNPDLVASALGPNVKTDTWKMLLDPEYLKKLQNCGVAFLDEPVQVFGITLFYLGLNPNSTNPEDYEKAADYLMTIRPYILYFDNNRYITDLAAGNLCVAMGYSGDTLRAQVNSANLDSKIRVNYALPQQGAPIWFDMFMIPAGAKHVSETMAFLNELMDPKVTAKNSNFLYEPGANTEATAYYKKELQTPGVIPDASTLKKLFNVHFPQQDILDIETRLWMKVRYGIE